MDISIKKIGERHDEASGLSHHEHGVYEGDQQIGSAVVAVKDGRAAGLKVKGLKTKHMSPLMTHLKTTYGDQMAKAIVGSAMPVTGKKRGKKASEPDLDHDRRRIKSAIFTMLGKTEAPHSPDGKVNLAKSLVGMSKYQHLLPRMQGLAQDLVGREKTNDHHDYAAYMVAHAQKHMNFARQHILQESPSKVDRVRSALGLQPLHMKHLQAAHTFIEAGRQFAANGDKALHKQGLLEKLPDSAHEPADIDQKGYEFIRRTAMTRAGQAGIPLALDSLRKMHAESKAAAATPASTGKTPVPPALEAAASPKGKRSKPKAPKNDA